MANEGGNVLIQFILGGQSTGANQAFQQVAAGARDAANAVGGVTAPATAAGAALTDTGKAATGGYNSLLALLGVSRLLPGELRQITASAGLLGSSLGAIGIGVGVAVLAITQAIERGIQFNEELNRTRAQSEGLGLTVTQFK